MTYCSVEVLLIFCSRDRNRIIRSVQNCMGSWNMALHTEESVWSGSQFIATLWMTMLSPRTASATDSLSNSEIHSFLKQNRRIHLLLLYTFVQNRIKNHLMLIYVSYKNMVNNDNTQEWIPVFFHTSVFRFLRLDAISFHKTPSRASSVFYAHIKSWSYAD